jgi:hypothetical protein
VARRQARTEQSAKPITLATPWAATIQFSGGWGSPVARPSAHSTVSAAYCDAPMRGGVAINSSTGVGCTAGLMAKKPDGSRWVLTAGHCRALAGYNPWHTWSTRDKNGTTVRQLGAGAHTWWYGGSPGPGSELL